MTDFRTIWIEDTTRESLTAKCQENGWLMRGGYDWQNDPFLEEYPYEFAECPSIDDLRSAFAHGNWAIRQGFLYDDIAFVQQVNGGDEWWTLKRVAENGDAGDWLAFESWSFESMARNDADAGRASFENAIRSMQMATPTQCKDLDYMLPGNSPTWHFAKAAEIDFSHVPRTCRIFEADFDGYSLKVYGRPSAKGYTAEIFDQTSQRILMSKNGLGSAFDAANGLQKMARKCAENGIHHPNELRDLMPLDIRSAQAIESHGHDAPAKNPPTTAKAR